MLVASRSLRSLYSAPQASCFLLKKAPPSRGRYGGQAGSTPPASLRRSAAEDGRTSTAYGLQARRATAANAVSPLSFPPLETPFPDPPFQKESTKGGKPRGAPARRPLWRGRRHGASLSPCLSRPKTGLPSARRRPTGCRRHSAAQPPLRHGPQGPGALVRPPPAQPVQGFDTVSAFRGRRSRRACFEDKARFPCRRFKLMSRGTPAPGSPGRTLQACGGFDKLTVRGFKRPA